AAMRSGAGLVRLVVAPPTLPIAQSAAYDAIAAAWPASDDEARDSISNWAHVVLIGPGLGKSDATRALVERVLRVWRGPVVLDADALNVFTDDSDSLAQSLGGRPAIITPHAAECGRLTGLSIDQVLERRFEIGLDLARRLGAVVLLKGVPTI